MKHALASYRSSLFHHHIGHKTEMRISSAADMKEQLSFLPVWYFCCLKVDLSHFAPNYFAVNLSADSCRAVLIQHVTLNLFIDTSMLALFNLPLPNYGIYMMSQPRLSWLDESHFSLSHQSLKEQLPLFSDLFLARWGFIKYIISKHVTVFFFCVCVIFFPFKCEILFYWHKPSWR